MTLVQDGDRECLWLTDQAGEVVKTTLDGAVLMTLQRPHVPIYQAGKRFVPTWVAVNEERFGGNGDIWVADGYGAYYVHRYDKSGAYISSINGTEGRAGAFACPHGIMFIPKPSGAELYIADRSNQRVQVYDADGNFKRVFGNDFLNSPCGFVHRDGIVYCPELNGRLAIIDADDKLITYLGEQPGIEKVKGWPNLPAEQIIPGKFNSPHGMAVAANGDLYVGEWIVGGRVTKLARV
jgi:sugar lactone lactonase YvrE